MVFHLLIALGGAALALATLRILDRMERHRIRGNMARWQAEAREFQRRARERAAKAAAPHDAPLHRLTIEAGSGAAWRAEYSKPSRQMEIA